MNLQGLKNIHLAEPSDFPEISAAPVSTAEPVQARRMRKVSLSPVEEFHLRLARLSRKPEALPDELAAILSQVQKRPMVQANGIVFDVAGVSYRFWHEDSVTCRPENVGQKALITYDPDELDVIYVLSDAGEFLEAIPRAEATPWFSAEASREIARHRQVAERVHAELRRDHAITARQEHDRAKSNAEAIQIANEFPVPGWTPVLAADRTSPADRTAPADRRVPARAENIASAMRTTRGIRDAYRDRREHETARLSRARGDLGNVFGSASEDKERKEATQEQDQEAAVRAMEKIF
jgi:hypothetical protein